MTLYYTPQITDPSITNANDLGESDYDNARMQGSVELNGEVWKWNGTEFVKLAGNPCAAGNGVPLQGGRYCTHEPYVDPDNNKIVYVTGAVRNKGGWFTQGEEPIYLTANKSRRTFVVTPLDSGGGLAVNQIDVYAGIRTAKPLQLDKRTWEHGPINPATVWIQVPSLSY